MSYFFYYYIIFLFALVIFCPEFYFNVNTTASTLKNYINFCIICLQILYSQPTFALKFEVLSHKQQVVGSFVLVLLTHLVSTY